MQGSTKDFELVVYRRQFSQHTLGVYLSYLNIDFSITRVEDESSLKEHKKKWEEMRSKKEMISHRQVECLPALVDRKNNEVIFGPEAIAVYATDMIANRPEIRKGSSFKDEIQILEMRTLLIDICLTYQGTCWKKLSRPEMIEVLREMVNTRLSRFEKVLTSDKRMTVVRTKEPTVIDIMLYDTVKFFEKQENGITDSLPNVREMCSRIEAEPRVKTFVTSPRFMESYDCSNEDVCRYVWGLDVTI